MELPAILTGKVRCPACSCVARHSRDEELEAEIREAVMALIEDVSGPRLPADDILEALGISTWGKGNVRAFVCSSCGETFDSNTERAWARRSKQIGDGKASAGYRERRDARNREEHAQ